MIRTTFASKDAYQFAIQFLQPPAKDVFHVQFFPDQSSIETDQPILTRLLERLANMQTVVLPYLQSKKHHWIIAGSDRRSLDAVLSALSSFLIPTYAEFQGSTSVSCLKKFDASGNDLQQAGHALFGAGGYYIIETPSQYLTRILERLGLWLDLVNKRPTALIKKKQSYRELHVQFNLALDQKDWETAELCLRGIQKLNLSTADNLYFLRIQLWALQNQWQVIWDDPNYGSLAKLKMPRLVRAALLSSAYFSTLEELEHEGKWEEALETFRRQRPKLGLLLTGRFGLIQEPVIRMFAYQAVVSEDQAALEELVHTSTDPGTLSIIESLKKYLPAGKPSTPLTSPQKQVLLALNEANYDAALDAIERIPNDIDHSLLLLEVAFFSGDLAGDISQKALAFYHALSDDQRQELQDRYPQVLRYINALELETQSSSLEATWSARLAVLRASTWRLICDLELQLRRIIEVRYEARFGDHWPEQIDQEWRDKWALAQQKDQRAFGKHRSTPLSILNYSYLGELMSMINKEWDLFEDIFGPRKLNRPVFTQKLESIVKVRNPLAHNRPIPESELRQAEKYARELLSILKRLITSAA